MSIRNFLMSKAGLAILVGTGFLVAFSDPLQALALQTFTMVGNYIILGTLQVDSLSPGGCVSANSAGKLSVTGLACGGGGGGVTAVTGSGNINSSGGATPNITTVASPTFTSVFAGNYTDSSLTPGNCVQAGAGGLLTTVAGACGMGSGTVTAVTGSGNVLSSGGTAPNITLVNSPTFSGTVTAQTGFIAGNGPGTGTLAFYDNGYIAFNNSSSTTGNYYWNSCNSSCGSAAGVIGTVMNINDGAAHYYLQLDSSGDLGVSGYLAAGSLASSVGDCLQVGASGKVTATASACAVAGSGVTSVTAGPSGNLTFAPTTGAVIGDIISSPTFSGTVTQVASNFSLALNQQWKASTGDTVNSSSNAAFLVGDVQNSLFGLTDTSSTLHTVASNTAGDWSVSGKLESQTLSANQCVATNGVKALVSAGSACNTSQTQHGNQSITAVAGTCTAGTPVTFSPAFSVTPDIVGSTGPVVGDTFAPTAITTTGFTPEVCSVASNAAVTVYWNAVN